MQHSSHFRKLLLIGGATCLFFAAAFSNSTIIKKIDGSYSAIIAQEIDSKKTTYRLQRQCQFIQARLIDMLLAADQADYSKEKRLILNDFQEIDKLLALLGKTAATPDTRKLVLTVTDSLLAYRRVSSTYLVLIDEKKISEASMLLRFNVHRSFSSATAALAMIPELLDQNLQTRSDQMSTTNFALAGIIQNVGSLPVALWLCAASLLFAVYWGVPVIRCRT